MNTYPVTYKKFIYFSILLHFTLLLIIFYFHKSGTFKHSLEKAGNIYETAIRVDAVGLPNVLKKDLDKIDKIQTPDKEKDKMILKSKKITISKLKAIDSLRSSLEKENYLEKIKIIKGLEKNNSIGGTGSAISKTIEAISNKYVSTLKELIRENWKIPTWVEGKKLRTVILVFIDSKGNIIKSDFFEKSGNSEFDAIALSSVTKAAPFPKPPLSLQNRLQQEGVLLSFP